MDMIASSAARARSTDSPSPEVGIGLKPQHYDAILDPTHPHGRPGWIEVHPQNYFGDGGPPHRWLTAISEILPVSFHSVGLSLGSADGLMADQLEKLALLCERYRPALVSDHLSFSGNAHDRFADLLPIPYTHEALDHFAVQVNHVQQRLGRQMLIENPSCYLAYAHNDMCETDFLIALTQRTACGLLLDINNIVVSTGNLGGSAQGWLERIDPEVVGEIHLAGHATEMHENGPLHIDDHGSAVGDAVWALYAGFIAAYGARPTLVEWDTDVPDYAVLMAEVEKASAILNKTPPRHGEAAIRRMAERQGESPSHLSYSRFVPASSPSRGGAA
jgi:uncharacterized protein